MKRSMKSTFAFVLIILLALSIVGCSKPGSGSADTGNSDNTAADVPKTTEAPVETSGKETKPYAGTTLTVLAVGDHIKDIDRTLAQQFYDETGITVEFQLYPIDQ